MRVLVATDGSEEAGRALDWLAYLPLPDESVVEVVASVSYPDLAERIRQAVRTHTAATTLDGARRRLARRWPNATARVLDGDPRETIVAAAAKAAADLVVVGARGLGAMGALLLGRVSIAVARRAPCPVLVCKGEARPLRVATIALDGGAEAQRAFAYFCGLPLPHTLSVGLVGVVEPIRHDAAPAPEALAAALATAAADDEAERRRTLDKVLGAAASHVRERVARTVSVTPVGSPAACILREAEREGSDLVVVGARALGDDPRGPLGSVSERVLHSATCPVLVVRTGH
jgi:nucleotide-binding universal stress UspA family protein